MKHDFRRVLGCFLASAAFQAAPAGASEIVYDNSTQPLGIYNSEKVEYGDEITLGGGARVMTELAFGYYSDYDAVQVFEEHDFPLLRTRVYANDGVKLSEFYTAPGTVLYDSGWSQITSGSKAYSTARFTGLNVVLPNEVTWTVEFAGFQKANESAGALFYYRPVVGQSFNFYWHRREDGSWYPVSAFDQNDTTKKSNYNLQITAVVPEPSTMGLLALGGLFLAVSRRRAS